MRRHEEHFNTEEQVSEYLARALTMVDTHEPPEDLRVPFFVKAVELLANKHVTFEQVQPMGVDLRAIPRGKHN